MNERKKLLLRLSASQFALWELHLYLDTHPCDRTAAEMCEKYSTETAALKKEYEEKYGALSSGNCENCRWLSDPWPWDVERGEN